MRRRLSPFGADSIRVSPMSIEWLQTHEAEYRQTSGEAVRLMGDDGGLRSQATRNCPS